MVKKITKKNKKRFGFSLTETIIMITVLAIVVASTTPIITRKIINNSDIGATLGGGSHGRYEVYTKEVLTFGPDRLPENPDNSKTISDYKKEKDPSAAASTVSVYEKKDKDFYKKMTGKEPTQGTGKTSTLYEEIEGVTPVENKDGTITTAKKNINGKVETYVAGDKYIFEDATYKYVSNNGQVLDKSKNRVIEGNITSKFDKTNPSTNNTLWMLTVKSEDSTEGGIIGYEKVTDSSIKGDLIVYQKKDDLEYKTITSSEPTTNGEYKSTLYEEIKDVTPIKDKDGHITKAKIKINGKEEIIKEDSKYIFENPQITYEKGVIKIVNGITTFIPDKNGETLDKSKNRIIEGDLTEKYSKNNPATNNPLWHIKASSGNYNGNVITIPWEKVISGSKEIIDRPLSQDSNGDYVGKFTPPNTAVNVVLHAVGGGGAGGGPNESSLNANVNPKTANSSEIAIMQKQLANRFRQVAKSKGLNNLASLKDSDIVKITYKSNIGQANKPSELLNDKTYILLNASNGTITVKTDVRTGMILPHELLDYTKILGAQTQVAEIHDMPKWFDWQNIIDGKFRSGAVACGGRGGSAGDFIWNTTNEEQYGILCIKNDFGKYTSSCINKTCTYNCKCPELYPNCSYPTFNCSHETYCATRKCICKNSQYYSCPESEPKGSCSRNSGPKNASKCDNADRIRNTNQYKHIYKGGSGGAAPKCVWVSTIAKSPIKISKSCAGKGYSGASGKPTTVNNNYNQVVSAPNINGENGATCYVNVNGVNAISVGGTGGLACIQDQIKKDDTGEIIDDADSWWNQTKKDIGNAIDKMTEGTFLDSLFSSYSQTNSAITMKYLLDDVFCCKTVPNNTIACGKNGQSGYEIKGKIKTDKCTFSDGTSVNCMASGTGSPSTGSFGSGGYGIGSSTGIYNYIYTWTVPYSTNYLGYGEAGNAGEYSTTKLSKIEGSLFIKLGKGGVWNDKSWQKGKKGPNGTDTIVKMGINNISAKKVLVAKGGQGGRGGLKTDNYDLCYANDRNKACSDDSNITCCEGKVKNSKEVSATNVRYSLFDAIKSFAGNSKIIGIGLGRGAQGAGTTEGEIEVFGSRLGINATADSSFNNKIAERTIYKKSSPSSSTGSPENTSPSSVSSENYKNKYLKPANVNFKGGDGAVIITW